MERQSGGRRTALITGGSSGFGYEFARIFAREGYELVLVARSEERLERVKEELQGRYGVGVVVLPKDLSRREAPDELFRELQQRSVPVDVLVNNAGFTVFGQFTETEWADEEQLMQVNVVALTHLTKLLLPGMVERGWGRILNMGSTASFQPGPLMAVYYASKAYVLSFSEALAVELQGTGVKVTCLCPGPTRTGFQKRGRMEDSRLLTLLPMLDVRTIARRGYRALMKGQTVLVPGAVNWVAAEAVRFIPRKLAAQLAGIAQQRR